MLWKIKLGRGVVMKSKCLFQRVMTRYTNIYDILDDILVLAILKTRKQLSSDSVTSVGDFELLKLLNFEYSGRTV